MRTAGRVNREIFDGLKTFIKPGITTMDIDDYVAETVKRHGMIAAEKGYGGFPGHVCTSVNEEVVHGIASERKLKDGDIVVVVRNGSRALIGKHAEVKGAMPNTVIGAFMTGIRSEYPSFVNALLDTPQFDKEIEKNMGATINQITGYMFSKMEFFIPSSHEEKRQIGALFKSLDDTITLHQRKYDELQQIKKYMLQKMFPKGSETKPEIRFAGFTDAWEQRKLSEVLEIVNNKNGNSYGKEDVLSVSDEYGCINQIRFQGRSFAGEDISNYKIVETGDIVYTRSPLKSKPYGIIKVVGAETGIVSPLYIVNKAKPGNDSEFIYRVFDSPEKTNTYLSPLVRKGAKNTMNISNDEWLSGEIIVASSFDEQKKIGEYFKNLDNLITLHQRKLEQLKNVKKALLQNMFI